MMPKSWSCSKVRTEQFYFKSTYNSGTQIFDVYVVPSINNECPNKHSLYMLHIFTLPFHKAP